MSSLEEIVEDNGLMERLAKMVTLQDRVGLEYLMSVHELDNNKQELVRDVYNAWKEHSG